VVDATSAVGFIVGVGAAFPITSWAGVQGELLFSRRRHAVDFRPYEAIDVTFTRDETTRSRDVTVLAGFRF
jgi:hypothetical protein